MKLGSGNVHIVDIGKKNIKKWKIGRDLKVEQRVVEFV